MKILLLSLLLFLISDLQSQTILRNLIPNPSFEYSGRNVQRKSPDEGWTFRATHDTVTGHVTSSKSIDGFRSYLIRAEVGSGILTSDIFELERRREYRFSFAFIGSGNLTSTVQWWRKDGDEKILIEEDVLPTVAVRENWKVVQYVVYPPRRVSYASVQFEVMSGHTWIDDVRFR